ncbi:hypothetical protein M8C13_18715 [Crossiella sp. SN42]|uniref:hypothetical protein n=1 Tax=Crossiella sp. SN42 TaxID=2944808 RepID=UPI00207C4B1E|nr:hypothetical protein [Crossiella sp. SN42]MCO1577791.1 hypothetical protein [Crossiella sp. SN42]
MAKHQRHRIRAHVHLRRKIDVILLAHAVIAYARHLQRQQEQDSEAARSQSDEPKHRDGERED